MTKDPRINRTRGKLLDAMTTLLSQKSFDDITTIELVTMAKISRSTFYTHYSDKYEMIDNVQQQLFNTIEYIFARSGADLHATLVETFELINDHPIYAALLSENGSKEIHQFILQRLIRLLSDIRKTAKTRSLALGDLGDSYAPTFYAHAILGTVQAWIQRKRRESPERLADLFGVLISDVSS
ncbi:MAG: TetR/AcrR family transcriptional regulator [Streptococcaceae bacterium]|jgi:AcrR family transcriptional regulator|nr:TetR/AcrR family transcriptional regulator [Streptococcaceae bacterium]